MIYKRGLSFWQIVGYVCLSILMIAVVGMAVIGVISTVKHYTTPKTEQSQEQKPSTAAANNLEYQFVEQNYSI